MILTEKHGNVDEEENEVGEVALAGEDACWSGHAFFVFWHVWFDCRLWLMDVESVTGALLSCRPVHTVGRVW